MKFSRLLLVSLLFLGFNASALVNVGDFALTVGARSNSADTNGSASSVSSKTSLQFGGLGFLPINDYLRVRLGFLYTQRYVTLNNIVSTSDPVVHNSDVNFTYLDVPASLVYQFSDYAGLFGGVVLAVNQSSNCNNSDGTTCSATGVNSTVVPIQVGFTFKFAPQLGGEIVYEQTGGNLADGVKNFRTIGINLSVFFD